MEQTRASKKPYSCPTLTPLTKEQATQFVAQRTSLAEGAAASFLESIHLVSEANPKKHAAHDNSNGNRSRLA